MQNEEEDNKSVGTTGQSVKSSNYRTLQVADMTTFMAKLIYKLTEMSCAHANHYIVAHNQIVDMEKRED